MQERDLVPRSFGERVNVYDFRTPVAKDDVEILRSTARALQELGLAPVEVVIIVGKERQFPIAPDEVMVQLSSASSPSEQAAFLFTAFQAISFKNGLIRKGFTGKRLKDLVQSAIIEEANKFKPQQ